MTVAQTIKELFDNKGNSEYGGEVVTQQEHALQCAMLAEQNNAKTALIVAALLHDVGHLLHELPDDAPDEGIDDHHETSGHNFLKRHFDDDVSEPVRLHVAAKRYLCTVDPAYESQLSEPSIISLKIQGGKMSETELNEFRKSPQWKDALELRKWDDLAKIEDLETPDLMHYIAMIDQVASNEGPGV